MYGVCALETGNPPDPHFLHSWRRHRLNDDSSEKPDA